MFAPCASRLSRADPAATAKRARIPAHVALARASAFIMDVYIAGSVPCLRIACQMAMLFLYQSFASRHRATRTSQPATALSRHWYHRRSSRGAAAPNSSRHVRVHDDHRRVRDRRSLRFCAGRIRITGEGICTTLTGEGGTSRSVGGVWTGCTARDRRRVPDYALMGAARCRCADRTAS